MGHCLPVPVGKRFGRLVVVGSAAPLENGRSRWLCRCDCGVEKEVSASCLSQGRTKSCGCLRRENAAKRSPKANAARTKHGHAREDKGDRHPLYRTWQGMRERCRDPGNVSYKYYGGRGITVCERWESFENFLADMGEKPSPDLTLDRIDNDGNYEPGNCRWATPEQQTKNRRLRCEPLLDRSEAA